MLGGLFLCFEGCEKLAHKLFPDKKEDAKHHVELVQAVANPAVDLVAFEKDKIKGAVRTDFILSAACVWRVGELLLHPVCTCGDVHLHQAISPQTSQYEVSTPSASSKPRTKGRLTSLASESADAVASHRETELAQNLKSERSRAHATRARIRVRTVIATDLRGEH